MPVSIVIASFGVDCGIIIFPRNVVFGDIMFSTATQPHRRRPPPPPPPPHHRIISLLAR